MLPETGDRKTEAIQRSLLHYIRSLSLFSTATIAFIITQNDRFWIIFDRSHSSQLQTMLRPLLSLPKTIVFIITQNDRSCIIFDSIALTPLHCNDRFYHYPKRSLLDYIRSLSLLSTTTIAFVTAQNDRLLYYIRSLSLFSTATIAFKLMMRKLSLRLCYDDCI